MICTTPVRTDQTGALPQLASQSDGPLTRQVTPSEYPLLEWLTGALQDADGLDNPSAVRAARQLLEQAFTSVDQVAMKTTHMETIQ